VISLRHSKEAILSRLLSEANVRLFVPYSFLALRHFAKLFAIGRDTMKAYEYTMKPELSMHMDKPAFLAWSERQEGRYELVEGCVVMMTMSTRGHALLLTKLALLFQSQLDRSDYTVLFGFSVDTGPKTLRFPDIMVECAGQDPRGLTTGEPVLLAEILSPSSRKIDLRDKVAEYLGLPSLVAYLVLAQDEPKAHVWMRKEGVFPIEPEVFERQDTIKVASLKLMLQMHDIYAGLYHA
jgi:Uma2 family endonuclease